MAINSTYDGINAGQEFQSGFGSLIKPDPNDQNTWYYTFPTEQFQSDLNYLWDLGVRKWRQASQSTNGFLPIIKLQDQAALLAKQKGFEVSYGLIPSGNTTPGDWQSVFAAQLIHAQTIQAAGSTDIYMVANEMENSNANPNRVEQVSSVSRLSNVVTVTTTRPWDLRTGDQLIWFTTASTSGGSPVIGIAANTFISSITVVDSTHFTFSNTGTDASATGGVWIQLGTRTIIRLIKRQATALKAAGITMKLSNSCIQGNSNAVAGNYWIGQWVSEGRGDLDYCDLNVYGSGTVGFTNNFDGYLADFKDEIRVGLTAFGNTHFRVTEWSANAQNGISKRQSNASSLTFYQMQRKDFLDYNQITNFVFAYRQNSANEGGVFAAANPYNSQSVTYRDWWGAYAGVRMDTDEQNFSNPLVASPTSVKQVRATDIPYVARHAGLQFNYGQDQQTGSAYNATTVNADFAAMRALGRTKIRIGFGDITFTAGVNNIKTAILAAKSAGLYVIAVCAGNNLTDANWSTYTAGVNTLADWCWANGVDEFSPGNELEYFETVSHTLSNAVQKIKDMGTDIKNNHFFANGTTRFLSYSGVAQSSMDYVGAPGGWIETGKGNFDLLGYNIYGDNGSFTQFKSRIQDFYTAFGSAMYVSEWNIAAQSSFFPPSESDQAILIGQRADYLAQYPFPFFFFTWRSDLATGTKPFALIVANTYRAWFIYLFKPDALGREANGALRDSAIGQREIV